MEKHNQFIAFLIGRRDRRTIDTLGEKYPELSRFLSLFSEELLQDYMEHKTLGPLEYFISEDINTLLVFKEKLALLNGRSMDEVGSLIEGSIYNKNKIDQHVLFTAKVKLESFYKERAGGQGLKDIYQNALQGCHDIAVEDGRYKRTILGLINQYRTAITRLEVSKHKTILADFINENLSEMECELLFQSYCKGK